MDEIEKLKGALENISGKRVTARLNKLMPLIDQRLRDGISHQEIIETLNDNGLSVNLHTFRTSLYRYRRSLDKTNSTLVKATEMVSLSTKASDRPYDAPSISGNMGLDDMLDPRKRDELGEKYLNRKPPIFKKKGATDENSGD